MIPQEHLSRVLKRVKGIEWPSLGLRLAAVGAGVIFVLIDPTASLAGPPRGTEASALPSLIVLLSLAAAGAIPTTLQGKVFGLIPAIDIVPLIDLSLVGTLVHVTSKVDSVFYLYFPLVLTWATVGMGLWRGMLAGAEAVIIFAFAAGGTAADQSLLYSGLLLPLFGAVCGGAHWTYRRHLAVQLEKARAEHSQLLRLLRTHSAVTAMAPLPLDARIERFLDEAVQLVSADMALAALVDDDGVPTVRGVRNLELRQWQTRRLRADTGIAARIMREAVPMLTEDASTDPEWRDVFNGSAVPSGGNPSSSQVTNGPRAAVAIPFTLQGRVIGLGIMGRWNGQAFDRGDIDILTILGHQAALALHDGRVQEQLRDLLYSAVNTLAAALEARDPYTRGHSQRVATSAAAIGMELGLPPEEIENIRLAALLHDIGKIATPETVLHKRGPLTPEERIIVNQHSERGAAILREMRPFNLLVDLVLYHQESYDGSGYPEGLRGEEIPTGARIIRVADAFDALISDRPYRRGLTVPQAVEELRKMAGKVLDPKVVDAFLQVVTVKPPFDIQLRMWRERA